MWRLQSFGLILALLAVSACGETQSGPPIDGAGGRSTDGPACTSDADCTEPGLPRCGAQGRCLACIPGEDCGPEPACLESSECPDDAPVCSDGRCIGCTDSLACADRDAAHCHQGSGACVECLVEADCPQGTCTANRCQETAGCTANDQCEPHELCVFPGGDATFGACASACDPYASGGCEAGRRCALVGVDVEGDPIGACLLENGGAGEQEPCAPESCEIDLLCVTYAEEDERCTSVCDPELEGACGSGFRCVEIGLTSPAEATIGICVPAFEPCESSEDCEAGEVCSIGQGEDGDLEQVCVPARGPGGAGARCASDGDCASNLCLSGQQVCYGGCVRDDHCAEGSACVDVNLGPSLVTACLPTCTDDASCGSGLACIAVVNHARDDLAVVCTTARGTGAAGTACTDSSMCRSGACQSGICYGICDDEGDCGGSTRCEPTAVRISLGHDVTGYTSDDVWAMTSTCVGIPCTTDASCGPGYACGLQREPGDTTGTLGSTRCVGAIGPVAGGEACTTSADCRSGLCFDPRLRPEDCDNGIDDDGDGLIDCEDPDCHTACFTEIDCSNGIDDDGDGAIDCADGDCEFECGYEGNCHDGLDDNGNGLIDCDDPDCAYTCGRVEIDCTNGRDDDGDGLTDCADPDCTWATACREDATPEQCSDGIDNDGDGFVDCQDPDCTWVAPCNEMNHESSAAACNNGLDDDDDGLIDCEDPGCARFAPCTETSCGTTDCCSDGVDNDGDGLTDCQDPDCQSAPSCNEAGRCSDGLDNDGDGLVDCFDPDCRNDPACSESSCGNGNCCSDGIDNDGDGGIDCVDADCFYTAACNELYCPGGGCCSDGIDNDGDGRVDCEDPDCVNSSACREFQCADGVDNDGDGLTDCEDPDCFPVAACANRICFESCEVEADCSAGSSCVPSAAWITLDHSRRAQAYANTCMPSDG